MGSQVYRKIREGTLQRCRKNSVEAKKYYVFNEMKLTTKVQVPLLLTNSFSIHSSPFEQ